MYVFTVWLQGHAGYTYIVFLSQINHHNLQIHIHGTATPISGQHFRGTLCDINPETMEFFVRETDNPEDGDKKTYNMELWDRLPGPLEDPPSTDLEFQERARSCVVRALDNLYYTRKTNKKGEEVRSWLFKEDPDGRLTASVYGNTFCLKNKAHMGILYYGQAQGHHRV